MNDSLLVIVLADAVLYGTPLLFASLGELLAERSGVLNLGVEGMMLFGAVVGFWMTQRVEGASAPVLVLAVLASGLAGAALAAIHAFLTITLRANQIVSGLALTIFAGGLGLSAYVGTELGFSSDVPAKQHFGSVDMFGLADLPVLGPIVFDQSALVYASWVAALLVGLYLGRTRFGLNVRAVGEAPASADAMGINVSLYRYVHVLVGGAFAGVAGACYSLSISPGWSSGDSFVGGAGWIAIALVIFAFWRAELCLVGAYLFGALSALPFALQARDVQVAPEFLYALPYVMTIVVLVLVSTGLSKRRIGAPAALGSSVRSRGAVERRRGRPHAPLARGRTSTEGRASRTRVPIQGGTDVMVALNFDRARPETAPQPERGGRASRLVARERDAPARRRADVHRGDERRSRRGACPRSQRRRAPSARRRSATAGRSAGTSEPRHRRETRCRRCSWRARTSRWPASAVRGGCRSTSFSSA